MNDEIKTNSLHERKRTTPDVGSGRRCRERPLKYQALEQEKDLHAIFFQKLEDDAALRAEATLKGKSKRSPASNWQKLPVTGRKF